MKVAAGHVGTSFLGFLEQFRVFTTETAASILESFGRHAALFVRKLRLASIRKNCGIVASDLPFKTELHEAVDRVAFSANHFPVGVASEHTDSIFKIIVTVQAEGHEILVELEVNGRGTQVQAVETTFDVSIGVFLDVLELKRVVAVAAERHGKAFVLIVSAFETEAAVGNFQNVPTDLRKVKEVSEE